MKPWSESEIKRFSHAHTAYPLEFNKETGKKGAPSWFTHPEQSEAVPKEAVSMDLEVEPLVRHHVVDVGMESYTIAIPKKKPVSDGVYLWQGNKVPDTVPLRHWGIEFRVWEDDFYGPLQGEVRSILSAIPLSKLVVFDSNYRTKVGDWSGVGGDVDNVLAPHKDRLVTIFASDEMKHELSLEAGIKKPIFIYESYNEEAERKHGPLALARRKMRQSYIPEAFYAYPGTYPLGPDFKQWVADYIAGKLKPTVAAEGSHQYPGQDL